MDEDKTEEVIAEVVDGNDADRDEAMEMEGNVAVGFSGIRNYSATPGSEGDIFSSGFSFNVPVQELADAFEEGDFVRKGLENLMDRRASVLKTNIGGKVQVILIKNTSSTHDKSNPQALPRNLSERKQYTREPTEEEAFEKAIIDIKKVFDQISLLEEC